MKAKKGERLWLADFPFSRALLAALLEKPYTVEAVRYNNGSRLLALVDRPLFFAEPTALRRGELGKLADCKALARGVPDRKVTDYPAPIPIESMPIMDI